MVTGVEDNVWREAQCKDLFSCALSTVRPDDWSDSWTEQRRPWFPL